MKTKSHFSNGFTLIELLAVIAVIGVLAAILIPALQSARKSANQSKCVSNLRQIAMAVQSFTNDNGGRFPETWYFGETGKPWCRQLEPYVGMESNGQIEGNLFRCPAVEEGNHHGWSDYGYNENLGLGKGADVGESARRVGIPDPAKVVMVGDSGAIETGKAQWYFLGLQYARGWQNSQAVPHPRHDGLANLAFVDGHVESLGEEELELRREEMFGRNRFYGPGIGGL